MFDVGFWELAVIGVIALVILGPERLPRLARTAGMWVGRARRMVATVKEDINKELESDRLKEIAESLKATQQEVRATASGLEKNILDTAAVDKDLDFDSASFQSEAPSEQPEDLETAPGENQQTAKKAVSKTTKTKSKSPKTSTTAKKSKSGVKKKQATT